jgi:hypothetical protein
LESEIFSFKIKNIFNPKIKFLKKLIKQDKVFLEVIMPSIIKVQLEKE